MPPLHPGVQEGSDHPSHEYNSRGYRPVCFTDEGENARDAPCARSPVRISRSRFTVNKVLMQGNKVIGEAPSGRDAAFMPAIPSPRRTKSRVHGGSSAAGGGGVFIQSESEIAAIHMVVGRAPPAPVHDLVIEPGISLKQEGSPRWRPASFRRHRQHDAGRTGLGTSHRPRAIIFKPRGAAATGLPSHCPRPATLRNWRI